MATKIEQTAPTREPLTKERILRTAVALADQGGVDSLSMRKVAQELGVVPMALYKHVANKDEMLDGMVDVVVGEIDPPLADADWKTAIRERVLSARRALLRHPWASQVIESRTNPTPTVIGYMDSMIGILRNGRLLDRPDPPRDARDGQPRAGVLAGAVRRHARRPARGPGDPGPVDGRDVPEHLRDGRGRSPTTTPSVVGLGCDDQFEFEFALDLMLDGLERLRRNDSTAPRSRSGSPPAGKGRSAT